jgi:hypothetical protein
MDLWLPTNPKDCAFAEKWIARTFPLPLIIEAISTVRAGHIGTAPQLITHLSQGNFDLLAFKSATLIEFIEEVISTFRQY